MDKLISKARYGILIRLTDYIQIPILRYDRYNNLNENPYILLSDIKDKYELVKGTASEEEYWNDVKSKIQQGKVKGYQSDDVFEIGADVAMVKVKQSQSTHRFWIPTEEQLTDDELDWLYGNTDENSLLLNGDPVTEIYIQIII